MQQVLLAFAAICANGKLGSSALLSLFSVSLVALKRRSQRKAGRLVESSGEGEGRREEEREEEQYRGGGLACGVFRHVPIHPKKNNKKNTSL